MWAQAANPIDTPLGYEGLLHHKSGAIVVRL